MSMNGIDISSYQAGIDLGAVPCDFAIVKATEGTWYTNPNWYEQASSALWAGRKLGFYHFASGTDAIDEADYFVNTIGDYIGKAILVLDWESDAVNCGTGWARVWLDRVYERTGVRPLIYMSNSVVNSWNWSGVACDYPLWNAAYYAGYEPMSYNYDPPIYGGMGAWNGCTIYQYTSSGQIDNWNSGLDLNIFYGNEADWDALAGGGHVTHMNEVAAQVMEHLCTCPNHGYTWGNRWGDGTQESITVDGQEYYFAGGDRDCSSAVISAYQAAGLPVDATYTGNMLDGFLATGLFEWKPMSFTAQRGDIYLNIEHHTSMCLSAIPDELGQFSIAENGTCYGEVGDQLQQQGLEGESNIKPYYDYPWDGILHFTGGSASGGSTPLPTGGNAPESMSYAVCTENDGWLPFVNDLDDFAGIQGHWIRYVAIDLHGHGWYQACTQDNGWLEPVYGCNTNDLENGCAGDGSPILAMRVYYETPDPNATGYWCARYRVSNVNDDYFAWQNDTDTWNGQDGYAGDMAPIDRFQLYLAQ